jgi:hypothetical protein
MSIMMPELKMSELDEEHYKSCDDHPQAPLATLQTIEESKMGVNICLEVRVCSVCKDVKKVWGRKFVFLLEVYKDDEYMFFAANKSYTISDARRYWLPDMPQFIQKSARSLSSDDLKEEQVLNSIIVSINEQLRGLADHYKDAEEPHG